MDKAALAAEINGDPVGIGYAAFLPDAPGKVCELMNAKTFTAHKTKMISWRGLYASYGIGPVLAPQVLAKIRAGAESNQVLYDIKMMVYSETGMDIGEPSAQTLISQLTPAVFTPEEADALRAVSLQPASRAEIVLGNGAIVSIDDLREAGVI